MSDQTPNVSSDEPELNDESLEQVAGGQRGDTLIPIISPTYPTYPTDPIIGPSTLTIE